MSIAPRVWKAADGRTRFRIWEPDAKRVWWVSREHQSGQQLLHEASRNDRCDGIWEVSAVCPEGCRYAFLVEWVQELRYTRGQSVQLSVPNDAADLAACLPEAARPPSVPKNAAPARRSLAELLGRAEFLLDVQEIAQVVSEAEGARLTFYVAPCALATAVEAQAGDGSWGPLQLSEAAALGPEEPTAWVCDALDFRPDGNDSCADIIFRVRRKDWRIDPYALVLSRDAGSSTRRPSVSANGMEEHEVPPGPAVWCHLMPPPPVPAAFSRCADRELVVYELHIGSFTPEGTFRAAASRLAHVRSLGCTALSIMPVQQDTGRLRTGDANLWGYDVMSLLAVDSAYGTPEDLAFLVAAAHEHGLAIIVDFVANHVMWGVDVLLGPHYFLKDQQTMWGPRPDFSQPEVGAYAIAAVEFCLLGFGFDGVRVDSTKSIRKFPDGSNDTAGALFLSSLTALCRRHGKLSVAEDLEDGDGLLQQGGLGFHLQWDMALFCWVYDALVNPMDEYRDLGRVSRGLVGLAPGRAHALRGRVIFMESHDTATSDRYGRLPAAVHNGKSFIAEDRGELGGDAFQKASGSLPYPSVQDVEANVFASRRAALGLVLIFTAPGVPMLLQGQELCDCAAYSHPRGPRIDWQQAEALKAQPTQWFKLCQNLIALRLKNSSSPHARGAPGPLMGDGLYVSQSHSGVLAYFRWAEAADSRAKDPSGSDLALVIVNCTNASFPLYEIGVPPASAWRLALTTVGGKGLGAANIVLNTMAKPIHDFPCSVAVSLQAYSAMILLQETRAWAG